LTDCHLKNLRLLWHMFTYLILRWYLSNIFWSHVKNELVYNGKFAIQLIQ
jgi:hypothetical protein